MKKDKIEITVCEAEYSHEVNPSFHVSLEIEGTEFYKQLCTDNKFVCRSPMLHKVRSALVSQLFPDVKKVIFNNPATIVCWSDGTKTVVKCQEGDVFDQEKGLALCFMKKIYGNTGCFNDVLGKYTAKEKDKDKKEDYFDILKNLNFKVETVNDLVKNVTSAMSFFKTVSNELKGEKSEIPEVKKCIYTSKRGSVNCTYIRLLDNSWETFKVLLDFLSIEHETNEINKNNYLDIKTYKHITNPNKEYILDLLTTEFHPCYIIKYTNPVRYAYLFEEDFKVLFKTVENDVKSNDLEIPEVKKCILRSLYAPFKYNSCYIKITNTGWPSVKKLMEFLGIDYQLYGINGENFYLKSVYDSIPDSIFKDMLLKVLTDKYDLYKSNKGYYIVKHTVSHVYNVLTDEAFSNLYRIDEDEK